MTQINVHADSHEYPVAVQAGGMPRPVEALVEIPEDSLTPVGDLVSHRAAKAQESQKAATADERAASDRETVIASKGFVRSSVHQGAGDNAKALDIPGRSRSERVSRWIVGKIGGPAVIEDGQEVLDNLERNSGVRVRTHAASASPTVAKRSQKTLVNLEHNLGYRERAHTALVGPALDAETKAAREERVYNRNQNRLARLGRFGVRS